VISNRRQKCDDCVAASRKLSNQRKRRAERARKRGAKREPYTLAEIAKRDRNRCGLCGKRVAMTKAVPHPRAPTIDHVLPLHYGGDDTRANVQLAHFICNSRKCTGGSQQLAMFG
jgi:5-methylcytosine-specific restriction endonuclease McrA